MIAVSDRDRLIELKRQAVNYAQEKADERGGLVCIDDEADYLLANGVIVPPCKVGDKVWFLARSLHTKIEKVKSGKVVRIAITENGIDLFVDNWTAKLPYGKRAFLTKEEAEAKLKERER